VYALLRKYVLGCLFVWLWYVDGKWYWMVSDLLLSVWSFKINVTIIICICCVKLTTNLHLVQRSKIAWSYTSTPQYAFMVRCLVKHKDNFTFNFYLIGVATTKRNAPSTPVTRSSSLPGHCSAVTIINLKWRHSSKQPRAIFGIVS
jgi:hypothetical protein